MSDNNINRVEDIDKKKSTYFAESQKRYGEKCVKYTVKYTLNESDVSAIVMDAIEEKLKRDGFLSEWHVVLNTTYDSVDNFML